MCPTWQVAAGGAAPLLDTADAVLAVRRVPEKLFGALEMHDAVQAALGPLRAALAVGGSRLERVSMGTEQQGLVAQLSQVRCVGVCEAVARIGAGQQGKHGWQARCPLRVRNHNCVEQGRGLHPRMSSSFCGPGAAPSRSQLRGRLVTEARACFAELQDALPREAAKGVPADGTVGAGPGV